VVVPLPIPFFFLCAPVPPLKRQKWLLTIRLFWWPSVPLLPSSHFRLFDSCRFIQIPQVSPQPFLPIPVSPGPVVCGVAFGALGVWLSGGGFLGARSPLKSVVMFSFFLFDVSGGLRWLVSISISSSSFSLCFFSGYSHLLQLPLTFLLPILKVLTQAPPPPPLTPTPPSHLPTPALSCLPRGWLDLDVGLFLPFFDDSSGEVVPPWAGAAEGPGFFLFFFFLRNSFFGQLGNHVSGGFPSATILGSCVWPITPLAPPFYFANFVPGQFPFIAFRSSCFFGGLSMLLAILQCSFFFLTSWILAFVFLLEEFPTPQSCGLAFLVWFSPPPRLKATIFAWVLLAPGLVWW